MPAATVLAHPRIMTQAGRRWRHLTVWLHAVTSIGWMSLGLSLLALLVLGATTPDRGIAVAATSMAHYRTGCAIRLPTAPAPVFATAVLAPLLDIAVGTVVGFPTPVLSIVALVVAAVMRKRALRTTGETNSPRRSATTSAGVRTRVEAGVDVAGPAQGPKPVQ
jgi:heme exporter protein D